jgi:hypothetical protein
MIAIEESGKLLGFDQTVGNINVNELSYKLSD